MRHWLGCRVVEWISRSLNEGVLLSQDAFSGTCCFEDQGPHVGVWSRVSPSYTSLPHRIDVTEHLEIPYFAFIKVDTLQIFRVPFAIVTLSRGLG